MKSTHTPPSNLMAQLLWILKNYPKYIHRHVLHLLQSTNYIVLAKVTTQQDYSIDQSQSSYMDPQTQIKPKMFLLLMSAVTINIWHVFIAKTRLLKSSKGSCLPSPKYTLFKLGMYLTYGHVLKQLRKIRILILMNTM